MCVTFCVLTLTSRLVAGEAGVAQFADAVGDEAPRRTDPGADGAYDPDAHRLVDLQSIELSLWSPTDPQTDPFTGSVTSNGIFARLDVTVTGLVNPPGTARPSAFDPFAYGPHPIYGFVEIDVDQRVSTGGELAAPEYRYLANVVRFGGKPSRIDFADRVALDSGALDGDFLTPPFVERHGEDFHLALLGELVDASSIGEVSGDGDLSFEAGETWSLRGSFFHRAHGYEPFSLASGGQHPGEYSPDVDLRFHHDLVADRTVVSLVVPLTNAAAALMRGEATEPYDADPSNQASVAEAVIDLISSANFIQNFPTGLPEEALILDWVGQQPSGIVDCTQWDVTALLGTSYTSPDPPGEFYVWTDVYPDPVRGDVDGDGIAGASDRAAIQQYIDDEDGNDGMIDGQAPVAGFGTGFNVVDINHNGVVNGLDILLVSVPGDGDDDGDVDLTDFALFQWCFTGPASAYGNGVCVLADFDADGDVDASDTARFAEALSGP